MDGGWRERMDGWRQGVDEMERWMGWLEGMDEGMDQTILASQGETVYSGVNDFILITAVVVFENKITN